MSTSIADYSQEIVDTASKRSLRALLDAILVDETALRTTLAASVVDYPLGRAEIAKLVTDLTDARAEVVNLVTDITAANTLMTANKTFVNALRTYLTSDGIINATALSAGSTPEQIASTAFQYRIDGVPAHKAAVSAGTAFSAADTINTGAAGGTFWGVWAVQINLTGTISTKSPGADQTYADEATAIAALPSADAGNLVIGYVTVECNTGASWTAQTDDLTPASDCTSANFYNTASDVPAAVSDSVSATASNPAAITASAPAAATATTPSTLTLTS